jgi:hypothetical protein
MVRELAKKLGAVVMAIGALTCVLANAALNHGCGGSRAATQVESAGAPRPDAAEASPKAAAEVATPADDPDCRVPAYMYATKAPIWVPAKCRGGEPSGEQTVQQAPPPGVDAQRQAP